MKARFLVLWVFLFSVLPLVAGLPEDQAFEDESIGLVFPAKLGNLDFEGKEAFAEAGLGYSARYFGTNQVKLDIIVYDKNFSEIPDGASSPILLEEFSQTRKALQVLETLGKIRSLEVQDEGTRELPGQNGINVFRWAKHSYGQYPREGIDSAETRVSECYLTGFRRKFLKIRVSYLDSDSDGEKAALEAIKAFGRLLPPSATEKASAPKVAKSPVKDPPIGKSKAEPAQEEDEPQFAIILDDSLKEGDPRVIAAWMGYATRLSDWVESHPEQINDDSHVKTFEEEVAAREFLVGTWQEVRNEAPGTPDPYLDQLSQVHKAGLMPEYVGEFLSSPEWKLPGNLRIKKFNAWMKTNLPDHQVRTLASFRVVLP
jgi:hypothetical protein